MWPSRLRHPPFTPGCGRWAHLEKFDEFNRLAIDFLTKEDS